MMINEVLPDHPLPKLIAMVREQATWKSYVVTAARLVIGGCLVREQASSPAAEVAILALSAPWQRRGIGRLLMEHIQGRYRALFVTNREQPATSFFEQLGFKEGQEGEQPDLAGHSLVWSDPAATAVLQADVEFETSKKIEEKVEHWRSERSGQSSIVIIEQKSQTQVPPTTGSESQDYEEENAPKRD